MHTAFFLCAPASPLAHITTRLQYAHPHCTVGVAPSQIPTLVRALVLFPLILLCAMRVIQVLVLALHPA